MKYSKSNPPLQCMMTQSTCYKGTTKMVVKGILWHSTGANNPNLKRYVQPDDNAPNKQELLKLIGVNKYQNDINHIKRNMGMNCWVGQLANGDVTTIQSMPWDFRPWGCGSGPKGSCNSGWIQFEICEDGLNNKEYFEKVYKEACEITAYLCDMFDIDPHGTSILNGVEVPNILCHQDSYRLRLGSNHGDIYHWFLKFGKDMDDVRNDVAALLPQKITPITPEPAPEPSTNEMYRVRTSWANSKSQKGAYHNLNSAITLCKSLGETYKVFNSAGEIVYPVVKKPQVGDIIKLMPGAKYVTGKTIPNWVINSTLYLREILVNGNYVFSTQKTGAITGSVSPVYVMGQEEEFKPYLVQITADKLNVRAEASNNAKIVTQVKKNQVYTIIAKNSNWGKLKSGVGWIDLNYVKNV